MSNAKTFHTDFAICHFTFHRIDLDCCFLHNCNLTTVVAARRTYGVVHIELAAVRANGQRGSNGSVVSSSLASTSL